MGTIQKPHTFVGDTKAKASEVNATFDTLYDEFNGNVDENNINMTRTEFKTALLDALKTVDGAGSGLDADVVDGREIPTELDNHISDFDNHISDFDNHISDFDNHVSDFDNHETDNTIHLNEENVEDIVNGLLSAGGDITLSYDDTNNNLTVSVDTSALDADTVDGQDYADIQNWVNTSADVPNADYADNAGQVDGKDYADIQTEIRSLYPVGSVYINAIDSTNPATLFGFGTWTRFGEGKVLVGVDSTDADFDTAEKTGGEKEHTLTDAEMPSHNHTGSTNTTGAHDHSYNDTQLSWGGSEGVAHKDDEYQHDVSRTTGDAGNHSHSLSIDGAGSDEAHNNLQPYITVYMWKRTA